MVFTHGSHKGERLPWVAKIRALTGDKVQYIRVRRAPGATMPASLSAVKGGATLAAGSLVKYGITPAFSAKTDVTMRFPVKNYPIEMISRSGLRRPT
jgi:hypothetical protein